MHLSIVGGHKSHLELRVLQQLKWLYQRDGNFTYCRPIFNPLRLLASDFGYMLSVGAIRFEGKFCASKKGGIGGGGRISTQGGCLGWL